MVGIEEAQQRRVALKQIGEKPDRFFVHVAAKIRELGEVLLALLGERIEIMDVQPLASKLGGQAAHASVGEHTPGLLRQYVGRAQRAGGRRGAEFFIRFGRPQEVAQPAGEFPIGDRRGGGSHRCVFEPI